MRQGDVAAWVGEQRSCVPRLSKKKYQFSTPPPREDKPTVTSSNPSNSSQWLRHLNGLYTPVDPTQYEISTRRASSSRSENNSVDTFLPSPGFPPSPSVITSAWPRVVDKLATVATTRQTRLSSFMIVFVRRCRFRIDVCLSFFSGQKCRALHACFGLCKNQVVVATGCAVQGRWCRGDQGLRPIKSHDQTWGFSVNFNSVTWH